MYDIKAKIGLKTTISIKKLQCIKTRRQDLNRTFHQFFKLYLVSSLTNYLLVGKICTCGHMSVLVQYLCNIKYIQSYVMWHNMYFAHLMFTGFIQFPFFTSFYWYFYNICVLKKSSPPLSPLPICLSVGHWNKLYTDKNENKKYIYTLKKNINIDLVNAQST